MIFLLRPRLELYYPETLLSWIISHSWSVLISKLRFSFSVKLFHEFWISISIKLFKLSSNYDPGLKMEVNRKTLIHRPQNYWNVRWYSITIGTIRFIGGSISIYWYREFTATGHIPPYVMAYQIFMDIESIWRSTIRHTWQCDEISSTFGVRFIAVGVYKLCLIENSIDHLLCSTFS